MRTDGRRSGRLCIARREVRVSWLASGAQTRRNRERDGYGTSVPVFDRKRGASGAPVPRSVIMRGAVGPLVAW